MDSHTNFRIIPLHHLLLHIHCEKENQISDNFINRIIYFSYYQQFKQNLDECNLDAYGPSVALDLPFAWREGLSEQEKINNDPDYVSANRACQDVLDRIKKTTIDTKDE